MGVMRVKEGWTGVSGVGAEDGADGRDEALEPSVRAATDETLVLTFWGDGAGRLVRDEEEDVEGVGVGVDEWEEQDEEAEEERGFDSVDM